MLYYLIRFKDHLSALNVLSYITFRASAAVLTALVFTWMFGPRFIAFMRKRQLTQTVREEGPQSHYSKTGTPTMGGLLILAATVFSTLLWARIDNRFIWLGLSAVVFLGALGFIDDYTKWRSKVNRSKGISPSVKMAGQMIFAVAVAAYLYLAPPNPQFGTKVLIPFSKSLFIDLGVWYVFFAIMVVVGSSNAVNLTDGLDGLAIGSLIISTVTFLLFAYLAGHARFSTYLRIIPVPGAGELAVFLAAVIGAGIGFLWFNCYPAQIFMGDTGSLFLGGALGLVSLMIKQELILIVVGGLFAAEVLSVLIQVYSFRIRGKRIFRMAPLHHHFELSGWPETKVTIRFWIISVVLALIALSSLKLR